MSAILVLNSGSSSLKFGVYEVAGESVTAMLAGGADWQDGSGRFSLHGEEDGKASTVATQQQAMEKIASLPEISQIAICAIGHRVVHGGPLLRRHRLIDDSVMMQLEAAEEFAPLHVPPALALIRYAQAHFPQLPQVACLDTAFHASLPEVARMFALPRDIRDDGVQRFGFHGLSCESILRQLRSVPERLVIAHLGNGCSITAVRDRTSIDTSMGLTPTGGVIMGTRCGDIDPGVLLFLIRRYGYDAGQLEQLLDHRSGLIGISGVSSDMRSLHQQQSISADAALAISMFCYSTAKEIAAMAAALGGIDMLVFTGGIGEHDDAVRERICELLRFLKIAEVMPLPSREDEQIALHTAGLTDNPRNGR